MNITHQADQHLAADPAYRKLQRAILALCVLLAPFALSLWFGLCPPFGDVSCPSQGMATLDAFRTMNPGLLKVFLALSVVLRCAILASGGFDIEYGTGRTAGRRRDLGVPGDHRDQPVGHSFTA